MEKHRGENFLCKRLASSNCANKKSVTFKTPPFINWGLSVFLNLETQTTDPMETLNKNWFAFTLIAIIFGLLGFIIGRQEKQHHASCPMMNDHQTMPHDIMIDGDKAIIIPEVKVGEEGERIIVIPPPPPPGLPDELDIESTKDIESIDVVKGENGEKKITVRVKTKQE